MELEKRKEFLQVIGYMRDILADEFPTSELTPEYLIISILDNMKCHANMIMDSVLMSESMDYLKGYFTDEIRNNKKPLFKKDVSFNKELNDLMACSVEEAVKCKSNKIGTEHIILALLNKDYNFKQAKQFRKCGLEYDYVLSKLSDYKDDEKPKRYINNNSNESIPLKSEIPSKISVFDKNSPNIKKYTIDVNEEISKNGYDGIIGRDDVLKKIIKVLSRRKKNNVILTGKSGVGKTSIVYKLAEMIESGNVPEVLSGKKVVMLDTVALVSGTHLRGMFEERVDGLFKELKNNSNYILFIDDMQNALRNNNKDKDCDLTDVIRDILDGGDVRVIGTISLKDYRNCIENNTAISNKLQKIVIEPSTKEETYNILNKIKTHYEDFHHVKYTDNAIRKAVSLAERYITNNSLPDSAIDVIDLTGASTALLNKTENKIKKIKDELKSFDDKKKSAMDCGDFEALDKISKDESALLKKMNDIKREINNDESSWSTIEENEIAETVSNMTNIPIARLNATEKETILHINDILKKYVIGQDEAVEEISKAIKRSRAGFGDKSKVVATLFFCGPSGCGKSLISKKLAENIYGSENNLIRFDMSEYQDKTSVNKLIGASAGYVGYENGGLLTEAIKNKPYCVLLFDEIEKADSSIYNLFLQLFDEGRLTDNNGVTVNFKNVIVIMTSNVGARAASERGSGIGFMTNEYENKKNIVEKSLKAKFNPEFLNRIDKIVHFNTLSDDDLRNITKIELDKLCERVAENNITIKYDDKVVDYVFKEAIKQKEYGARPIMRIIQDNISDKIVDMVLASENKKNFYSVTIDKNGKVVAKTKKI